jgi:hypothetical protein
LIGIIQADHDVRQGPVAQAGQAIKHSCGQTFDATVAKQPHEKHRVGRVPHEIVICLVFNLLSGSRHVV